MCSVLEASRETLETINLPYFEKYVTKDFFPQFVRMRFPRLRSLSINYTRFSYPSPKIEFFDFLVVNGDTLEELDVYFESAYSSLKTFEVPGPLKKDSLPRLKKFVGQVPVFNLTTKSRMDCLHTSLEQFVLNMYRLGIEEIRKQILSLFTSYTGLYSWRTSAIESPLDATG